MAQFLDFTAPDRQTAVASYIRAKFGRWEDDVYIPPDLTTVRTWALSVIRQQARERAAAVDQLISDQPTLATEVVIYFQAGRPADPSPAVYVVADALANRRGVGLRATLEGLLTRWRNVQAAVAGIVAELDRVEGEIANASDIAGVRDALASLAW